MIEELNEIGSEKVTENVYEEVSKETPQTVSKTGGQEDDSQGDKKNRVLDGRPTRVIVVSWYRIT